MKQAKFYKVWSKGLQDYVATGYNGKSFHLKKAACVTALKNYVKYF